MIHDVIIVGGSYAGLSAALQLARARRQVLVLDAGQRRNRFASSSHGFLGQDGASPGAIAAKARAEVLAYPTVAWYDAMATDARATPDGFVVKTGADVFRAKRIILATGVVDELPNVPGLVERWGKTVFHCPYCHGYELGLGRLGVLATSPLSSFHAMLVSEWAAPGQMTLFVLEGFELDADQAAQLTARGIRIEREPVVAATGEAPALNVHLRDGRIIPLDGLFAHSHTHLANPFAEQLGCELEAGHSGWFYKTDAMKETTVPGVFACGDNSVAAGSVATAVGDGVRAGTAAHRSLVFPR
ncbi:NAD(P)/FAD-dependent oxidoreductase [Pendulispora brunnea]|uniref:NAD(P)/FAD-dependent oxidoreductase n=1 Tax=Pendulispora brunnea TaxID=2905690 RepID=A0ABZ2KAL1_9BACT